MGTLRVTHPAQRPYSVLANLFIRYLCLNNGWRNECMALQLPVGKLGNGGGHHFYEFVKVKRYQQRGYGLEQTGPQASKSASPITDPGSGHGVGRPSDIHPGDGYPSLFLRSTKPMAARHE
jgi:hypothetical protein